MTDKGYLVRFKNYALSEEGTGKLHYQVLSTLGQCIWGQWTANGNPMYESTFKRMNDEAPFYLYALDKQFALLKMKVERVLRKEEVINEQLGYLIPTYYSVDTPCASYYLISQIDIFPPEEATKVIITSSGNCALNIAQVNSRGPMAVYWDEHSTIKAPTTPIKPSSYMPPQAIDIIEEELEDNSEKNNYVVYRYRSINDGKTYIGLTGNLKQRIAHHSNPRNWRVGKEKWKVLYMFFSMYGYDQYEFTVLHEGLTKEEAEYWEAKEIENHDCYYPKGMNVRNESRHLNRI